MAINSDSGTWAVGNNWPWPRFFITDYYLLAVAVDGDNLSLYELVSDGTDYNATKIYTLGSRSSIDYIGLTWAERHYVITVFGYTAGTITINMYGRWPRATPGEDAIVPISSGYIPFGTAVCYHRGQLLVGGLKSNDLKWAELGSCAVAYGGIGNVTFDPEQDPTAGFVKMPWDKNGSGKVYHILSLDTDAIVYGDRGIERLIPFGNDVITGYGQKTLRLVGIAGFNCVAGDDKKHCFIDVDNNLCLLSDGLKVLGYKNYISNLTKASTIISYEPVDDYFYISDGVYCYVLTPNGLYQTHQCPTSVGYFNNTLVGFVRDTLDTNLRFTTTAMDFKTSSLKTVKSVECSIDYLTSINAPLYGKIMVKYKKQGDFLTLPQILMNDEGIFSPFVTGRTFKICFEGPYVPDGEFNLSSIKANVNFTDARTRRGLSDTTSRT